MRLCDETVTVYNARVDPVTRAEVWTPTVLRGVSWRAESASRVEHDGLRAANGFTLRIPEAVDAGGKDWVEPKAYQTAGDIGKLWTLQKGDVIMRGSVSGDLSPARLCEIYGAERVMTVLGVSDNRRARHARHWRVTGA